MPELPDVEGHRRTVAEHVTGRPVRGVRVPDPALLAGTTPGGLGRSLTGRVVAEPRRHGKWLLLTTRDEPTPTLVLHFRMTGRLTFDEAPDGTTAVALLTDEGALCYRTRRRLGGVTYLRPGQDPSRVTGTLGPDVLGIARATLARRLAGRRGGIKSALMDQRLVAGLGNELVDEILWRAGIAPRRPVAELDHARLRRLHRELGIVLRQSVRVGHVPAEASWLNAHRDAPDPRCPRCDEPLRRERVAGRTTLWCPREQTG